MKKITLLICLVIILNAPISAYAQATSTTPTVTIAAGSGVAVGGVFNQNGSKTAMMATALTLAVLSATGAAVKLTDASIQAGKTVYQVINDKFAQWVGGTSAEDLTPSEAEELQSRFKVITGGGGDPEDPDNNQNNGTNIDNDGKLWFSPGSLAMLKKFTDWLESTDQVNNYQPSDPTLGEYNTFYGTRYNTAKAGFSFSSSVGVNYAKIKTSSTSSYNVVMFATEYFTSSGTTTSISVSGAGPSGNSGNFYYKYWNDWRRNFSDSELPNLLDLSALGYYGANGIQLYLTTVVPTSQSPTIPDDGIYKGENYDSSILNNPNNQSLVIDPGILQNINPSSDQQIAIPDYLQLLLDQAQANATAQNQPINVPAIDPATLEVTPLEVPVIEQDPISDPVPSEEADPIETPDNPVQDPEEVPTPEEAVELMKVDLTRIFPFCIPWDLYRLIEKFNADPVTPSLTIDWGDILGSIGVDFETTIDLHDYDGVAQVLRTMETVAFVIGLAVATRSIFLQS